MDRIKQALEFAQHRTSAAAQPKPPPAAPEIAPVRSSGPPKTEGRGEMVVVYTQTRRVPVAPDVLERNRLITGTGKDEVTSAYKLLRTQILQRLRDNRWNALAVVSARAAEGRTLTAINLAISLAQETTHSVLLVDLDLHTPSVHRYFELEPKAGLSDYLLDGVSLKDIMINPGIDRLVILPGCKPIANSSEMLSAPCMTEMVAELKSRYPSRIILFDLPPLLTTDDALAFSPLADAALLVIEDGRNPKTEMDRAVAMLQSTPVLGAVLNKYNGRH